MTLKDGQILRLRVLELALDTECLTFILSERRNGIKYQVSFAAITIIDNPLVLDHILKRLQQRMRHIIPGVVDEAGV